MKRRSFLKGTSTATLVSATGFAGLAQTKIAMTETNPYHFTPTLEKARQLPGLTMNFIATGKETGGAYALIEAKIIKGAEPMMHTHQYEDEAFYILEGEMIVTIGGQDYRAKPGDYVFLPRGIPHTQKLISEQVHAMLFISPAGLEDFFWKLSQPAEDFSILPLSQIQPSEEEIKTMMQMQAEFGISYSD